MWPKRQMTFPVLLGGLVAGCVELSVVPTDGDSVFPGPPGTEGPDPTTQDDDVAVVTLTISDPTPRVDDEVLLACSVTNGARGPFTFEFQPDDGRLFADPTQPTAAVLIEASDIGSTLTFTCTATNSSGTSEPSNVQAITPVP